MQNFLGGGTPTRARQGGPIAQWQRVDVLEGRVEAMRNMDWLGTGLAAALCFALGVWLAPSPSVAEECASGTAYWGRTFELVGVVGPGSQADAQAQALKWGSRARMSEDFFETNTEPPVVLPLSRQP